MGGKRLETEAEVDAAVDALMTSLGVRDDGSSQSESEFEVAAEQQAEAAPAEVAPSADVGELWGAPKPKKKK